MINGYDELMELLMVFVYFSLDMREEEKYKSFLNTINVIFPIVVG